MSMLDERIRFALELREMTQADLARATGMSTAIIAQICNGTTKDPRLGSVLKIASALDVSLDFLAGRNSTK